MAVSLTRDERDALRAQGNNSIARLMLQVYRNFQATAAQRYAARDYAGLTLAHTLLMASLDDEGTRIGILAERMGMTKQFAGRLVKELEGHGFVATATDATDHRVTRVQATDAGWRYFADACEVKSEIEAEFERLIGTEAMNLLTAALRKVTASETGEPSELNLLEGQL